jgi:phage/plasmid-associated DNA primase
MPRVYGKADLVTIAVAMAAVVDMRLYNGLIYVPVDYETGEDNPAPDRTIWTELNNEALYKRTKMLDILFSAPVEFANFKYMLRQQATPVYDAVPNVLVKDSFGQLGRLTDMGFTPHTVGDFVANYIPYTIIPKESSDYKYVEELFKILVEWLDGETQARSLLYHLATALQPGWSAVKYIILLGEGRNGKGTLLKMLKKLLGKSNISGVQRQAMAAQRPILNTLNNKLANIVFDGPQAYIPESGPEKTIVAGEPLIIELKFENEPFEVQTNALFIEALNKEPKARDKSAALQKRLVRFNFPNEYPDDLNFLAYMQSEKMMDALLTLLWEHWVPEDELSSRLAPSEESKNLQVSHIVDTSPVLAFLEDIIRKDGSILKELGTGEYRADKLADILQPWLHNQGYGERTANDVWDMLGEHFVIKRVTRREGGKPATRRLITEIKPTTLHALGMFQKSDEEDQQVAEG